MTKPPSLGGKCHRSTTGSTARRNHSCDDCKISAETTQPSLPTVSSTVTVPPSPRRRAAAGLHQLRQLGEKVGVEVYGEPGEKDAPAIVRRGMEHFKDRKVIIIDTSGRHALEDDLIKEIKDIAAVAKPDERFLVLDSQVGQQAGPQAEAFHNAVGVTGIVCIGVGEHIRDLEPFKADKFISRLLGMGDISALVDMAKDGYEGSEQELQDVGRKMMSGKFTLRDMYQQMEAMNKMGPLKKIMSMIPGMSKMEDKVDFEESQQRLARYRHIMDSMTLEEQEDPSIIKSSRVQRIAAGSGTSVQDVRELLKQFNQSRKAIKGMMGNRRMRKQMMKQMGVSDMDLDSMKE